MSPRAPRLLSLLLLATGVAHAATYTVTVTFDSGPSSLREAMALANANPGDDTIVFDPILAGHTITLTTDDPTITPVLGPTRLYASESARLTLDGSNAPGMVIDAGGRRAFAVAGGATLALEDLELTRGSTVGFDGGVAMGAGGGGGSAGLGGGVFVATGATLEVRGCLILLCSARGGSGGASGATGSSAGAGGAGLAGPGQPPASASVGGAGGGPNPGAPGQPGGAGGWGGGGGGGDQVVDPPPPPPPALPTPGTPSYGGNGGFGGGGGGSGAAGNFLASANGGNGGFGGGGGGIPNFVTGNVGSGGFAGGPGRPAILGGRGGDGAGLGGAIFNDAGTVIVVNSTLSNNSAAPPSLSSLAQGMGGAIFSRDGTVRVVGSTIHNQNGTIGVYLLGYTAAGATAHIENTIIANHRDNDLVVNALAGSSVTLTGSGNLIETSQGAGALGFITADPDLQSIEDNGGPTRTRAIPPTSPAVGQANAAACAAPFPAGSGGVDQRGVPRALCSIGAFDYGGETLQVVSGSPQNALINTSYPVALRVRLLDAFGDPQAGTTVTFTRPGSGASASLSAPSAVTDASGEVEVLATANGTAGAYAVQASVPSGATVDFTLTNTTLVLERVSGHLQRAVPYQPFPLPLTVRVRDNLGNLATGIPVTFTPPAGGASAAISSATPATNSSGEVSITATANGTSGAYSVDASVATGASVGFGLTNATLLLEVIAGANQRAVPGHRFTLPLTFRLRDDLGQPVAGVTLTFVAAGSGASASLQPALATTDASGQAFTWATANATSGSYTVTVIAPSGTTASVSLTNLQVVLERVSGDMQQTPAGEAFAQELVVRLRDEQGAPLVGLPVTFSAPGSGASASLAPSLTITDAHGHAATTATANSAAGTCSVEATAEGERLTFSLEVTEATPQASPPPAGGGGGGGGSSDCALVMGSRPWSGLPLGLLALLLLWLRRPPE